MTTPAARRPRDACFGACRSAGVLLTSECACAPVSFAFGVLRQEECVCSEKGEEMWECGGSKKLPFSISRILVSLLRDGRRGTQTF